jgi:Spy/CpxP family protein refolding chaperone
MKGPAEFPGIKMLLAVADEINLTSDQKDKLKKLMVDFKLAQVDQKAKVKKAEIKLRALMRDEDANDSEVMTAIDEVARLKAELQKLRYRHRKEVRSLLTAEQIEKLKELRKERREMMPEHHLGMGPGGPGYGFDFDPDADI